jgi:hypothetical protein
LVGVAELQLSQDLIVGITGVVDVTASLQVAVKEKMPELESGCARAEQYQGRKPTDMFSFLLSHYRQPPLDFRPNSQRRDTDNMAASKAQRFDMKISVSSFGISIQTQFSL